MFLQGCIKVATRLLQYSETLEGFCKIVRSLQGFLNVVTIGCQGY